MESNCNTFAERQKAWTWCFPKISEETKVYSNILKDWHAKWLKNSEKQGFQALELTFDKYVQFVFHVSCL